MLRILYDRLEHCGIIEIVPGPQRTQDWEQGIELLLRLDEEAARQGRSWLVFVLTSAGSERPNANIRKLLAGLRSRYQCKRRCMVIVSESLLFRGALNAVNLLAPNSSGTNIIVSSIQDGIDFAERWRGASIPLLRRLRVAPTLASQTT